MKIKEHTWRKYYTICRSDYTWLIDIKKVEEFAWDRNA
jgi:hypothetical protein